MSDNVPLTAMERVVQYMVKVQKCQSHRLPKIAWEASKKIQKMHKSKILCSGWMQDMKKWFGRWDATHLLHDASLDSFVNEAFLQCQCIMTYVEAHASHIILQMLHLTTNSYSSQNEETTHIDAC